MKQSKATMRALAASLLCTLLVPTSLAMEPSVDESTIEQAQGIKLTQHLHLYVDQQVSAFEDKGFRVETKIGKLSPHIEAKPCDSVPAFELKREITEGEHNTVVIACHKPNWQVYIPAQFKLFDQLISASTSVGKNTRLTHAHLELSEHQVNKGRYANYKNSQDVIGMVAKRTIRQGAIIKPSHLRAPTLIQRGDEVLISAQNSSIAIQMKGEALSAGALGQQIRVKNLSSNRVIKAQVIDSGRVSVFM